MAHLHLFGRAADLSISTTRLPDDGSSVYRRVCRPATATATSIDKAKPATCRSAGFALPALMSQGVERYMIAMNEIVVDNIRRSATTVRCTLSWHRLIDGDEYRGHGDAVVHRTTEQVDLLEMRAAVDALPIADDDRSRLRDDLITAARTALVSREPSGQTFRSLTLDE